MNESLPNDEAATPIREPPEADDRPSVATASPPSDSRFRTRRIISVSAPHADPNDLLRGGLEVPRGENDAPMMPQTKVAAKCEAIDDEEDPLALLLAGMEVPSADETQKDTDEKDSASKKRGGLEMVADDASPAPPHQIDEETGAGAAPKLKEGTKLLEYSDDVVGPMPPTQLIAAMPHRDSDEQAYADAIAEKKERFDQPKLDQKPAALDGGEVPTEMRVQAADPPREPAILPSIPIAPEEVNPPAPQADPAGGQPSTEAPAGETNSLHPSLQGLPMLEATCVPDEPDQPLVNAIPLMSEANDPNASWWRKNKKRVSHGLFLVMGIGLAVTITLLVTQRDDGGGKNNGSAAKEVKTEGSLEVPPAVNETEQPQPGTPENSPFVDLIDSSGSDTPKSGNNSTNSTFVDPITSPIDSSVHTNYKELDWKDLPPDIRAAYITLGWNRDLWDNDGSAATDTIGWPDLTEEEKAAALLIGYTEELWCKEVISPMSYTTLDWKDLPPDIRAAYIALGWNRDLWDNDGSAVTNTIDWPDLTEEEREAARFIGYTEELWSVEVTAAVELANPQVSSSKNLLSNIPSTVPSLHSTRWSSDPPTLLEARPSVKPTNLSTNVANQTPSPSQVPSQIQPYMPSPMQSSVPSFMPSSTSSLIQSHSLSLIPSKSPISLAPNSIPSLISSSVPSWMPFLHPTVSALESLAPTLSLSTRLQASAQQLPGKAGIGSDHVAYENVALHIDTAVIGVPFHRSQKGLVLVLVRDANGQWLIQAELAAPSGPDFDEFGWTVAIFGDTVIIGAPGGGLSSKAHVFVRSGAAWSYQAALEAPEGDIVDYFGCSVGLFEDTAIVGAYGADGGSAHIFSRNGDTWSRQAKVQPGAPNYFGDSVAIHKEFAIVGAYNDDEQGRFSGSAHIFARDGEDWAHQAKLLAPDGAAGDEFGKSVGIHEDHVVVGACREGGGGSAHVFKLSGNVWAHQSKLLSPAGDESRMFGYSVDIDLGTVIVGSYGASEGKGSVDIFFQSGASWTREAELSTPNGAEKSQFGSGVAVFNGTYIIHSAGNDETFAFFG